MNFAFFGTGQFAVNVLKELEKAKFTPNLIVTVPDQPAGRGRQLKEPPVKSWAKNKKIKILQPDSLNRAPLFSINNHHSPENGWEFFLVADYGKIIPKAIWSAPTRGTLNVHPSLLPRYRGPSPIESQILAAEKDIGVTIIVVDEELDHGPIIASERWERKNDQWENMPNAKELETILANIGGKLLAKIIPSWIKGKIKPKPQNHAEATYTKKLEKKDFEINLATGEPRVNFLKIQAAGRSYAPFFFTEKNGRQIRVIVKKAEITAGGALKIISVVPEGRREMPYADFLRGLNA
jgi:methionyl-tRNA formyltransferase